MPGPREDGCSVRWFERAFGFHEGDYEYTRSHFDFDDGILTVKSNNRRLHVGPFELLSFEDLTRRLSDPAAGTDSTGEGPLFAYRRGPAVNESGLTFENIVDSCVELLGDAENKGAVFQVASQFNCLQAEGPEKRPDNGVTEYALSQTQGSVCAILCPAATVFRNYFVNGKGQARHQIDCLADVAEYVRNKEKGYWSMKNGHCMPRPGTGIADLSAEIRRMEPLGEDIEARVKVGIHWDTDVHGSDHRVCQVLCSAAPVALSKFVKAAEWEPLACCFLGAAYKTTLAAAALLAAQRRKRVRVFLTIIGGGYLGNRVKWINRAIREALQLFREAPLDVVLVHPSRPGPFEELEKLFPAPAAGPQRPLVRTITEQVKAIRFDHEAIDLEVENEFRSSGGRTKAEVISEAFSYFDADGNGSLDRSEFENALRSLDPTLFTPARVDRLLAAADADGDGEIYYGEFCAWLCDEDSLVVSRVMATATLAGVQHFQEGPLRRKVDRELSVKKQVRHRRTHCAEGTQAKDFFDPSRFM
eukprot:TRINITY_DN319_c0_g1_i1.p1 TRINITY_DN319_c0_g1~~TRINITY_DN319_c0_g1_i1.p1  ORF type:complete len:530 (+),score=113.16 TRINITY_DN319_c0_g1_i1:171-1760(+)